VALDARTLFVAQICALSVVAITLWLNRSEGDRASGLRDWMLSAATRALAFLLILVAGQLPALIPTMAAHALGAISVLFSIVAVCRFLKLQLRWPPLLSMVFVITAYSGWAVDHPYRVAALNGCIYACAELGIGLLLLRESNVELRKSQRLVAAFCLTMGVALAVRTIMLVYLHRENVGYLDLLPGVQGFFFLFSLIYIIVTSMGFLLMCKVRAEAETYRQAVTDSLTSLFNRRAFDEALRRAIAHADRSGRTFSLILVDADHFKPINDQHGHSTGDRALISIARKLHDGVRQDDFVCRFGGEEFCVLLPDTLPAGAMLLAERLRESIAEPDPELPLKITASFGVSGWQRGDDPDAMLSRVDLALYRAKKSGRNRVELFHSPAPQPDPVPAT
jgi:diguanylate cyclase (GGDEF)-like protein